jgi:hypothetical protein
LIDFVKESFGTVSISGGIRKSVGLQTSLSPPSKSYITAIRDLPLTTVGAVDTSDMIINVPNHLVVVHALGTIISIHHNSPVDGFSPQICFGMVLGISVEEMIVWVIESTDERGDGLILVRRS